jgi:hypothetical protein
MKRRIKAVRGKSQALREYEDIYMTTNCEVRDPKPQTAKKPGVRLRSRL